AREASQAGAAAAGSRSASTDQLTSPTAGDFAKEGGLRRRAMSYQQPAAAGTPSASAAPSVVPPWQQQSQQQQQQQGQPSAPYTAGYRPWSSSSSASVPPLSPVVSEFRHRSDSISAPPSAAPAPIDRFKSPTSPTPTTAGLPPKPPPLINIPAHRPRERDREQDAGGFGPPPPMPAYLGLPRRRSVSESQEVMPSAASGRVKALPTGDSEERSLSGSDGGGGPGGLRLPPKPNLVSSDPSKVASFGQRQSDPLDSDPRSPTSVTHPMSDYANSTAAKLRSQPAPEPIPLNPSRRRSSTGPTAAMAAVAAAAAASANAASTATDSRPSSPTSAPWSRRQSSLSIAIDTTVTNSKSTAANALSPRSPRRPDSPLRPKTPTSGGRLVESPTSRGRAGRVSRLSSPNKHSPSPGRIAAVVSGELSDTSSGVPMDLDSNMAVGFGMSASPEPRKFTKEAEPDAETRSVGGDNDDHVEAMDVDEPAPQQAEQVAEAAGRNGSSVGDMPPHSPPIHEPNDAPAPAPSSPSRLPIPATATALPGSPSLESAPQRQASSSPPRAIPSRSMRHALGIASPTQPEPRAAPADTFPPVASVPAPFGVSSPVPMPHVPTPPVVPPVLLNAESAASAATPSAAPSGGGRKRKQPISTELSPSVPSLAPTRAKRSRKGSAVDAAIGAPTPDEPATATTVCHWPSHGTPVVVSCLPVAMQAKASSNPTSQGSAAPTNGRPSATGQPSLPTATPPPPNLTINTTHGSTTSLPPVTQGGVSHSGSQVSLSNPNGTKMSFAFLLNDSGDDPMDTSPDSSPVRQQPTSPLKARMAPQATSDAAGTKSLAAEPAPPAKSASRRSDFDHEMTDEDVAALLTSMQSPSNVRPGTAASSARQSRQPTPRSASSTTQLPPPTQSQQAPAGIQQQLSGRSVQSRQTPPGPPAAVTRQHSASLSQPPTPRQQAFLAAAAQQQQTHLVQAQHHQQQRRLSAASMSEHSQGYPQSPYAPPQGPPTYVYAPPPQPPQFGYQPPPPPSQPHSQHQHPNRPPPPQIVSPNAYHFTMNPANMPGSPTTVAPPGHSPPPAPAYAHDPRTQARPLAPTGPPPAHHPPYGYHGQPHPAAASAYGHPQMQQPPTPTHHQHPAQYQHQQAAAAAQAQSQYQQQWQQQQQVAQAQAQAQAQYIAAMQQQQQHVANSYPQADPYGRRGSIPGHTPSRHCRRDIDLHPGQCDLQVLE
ncbi:hypothetical protein BCR44DRAFT_1431374, partial [Catenaria anguillulae PL171]